LLKWLCFGFLAGKNHSANSHFKEFDYMYVRFLAICDFTMVMK